MGGPSWLAWTFASVMIVVAVYCVVRLLTSWRQRRPTHRHVDAVYVLMGVAMAGLLVPRLRVFWAGGWQVVFGISTAWFAWLAVREFRGRPTVGGRPGHHLQHLLACGVTLYMYLAVATAAKGAAAGLSMGAAGGAAHVRTLALVLAFALLGYVVWNADRLSSLPPVAVLAAMGGDGRHHTPGDGSRPQPVPGRVVPLSPRLAVCCEIAMGVTMGYMLILML
jgi:hypothetical protein